MRQSIFRLVKTLFILSIIGIPVSILVGAALPRSMQQSLGVWLNHVCPCTLFPAITSCAAKQSALGPYVIICLLFSVLTAITTGIITSVCFPNEEEQYAGRQLSDTDRVRRYWFALLAVIAIVMGFASAPRLLAIITMVTGLRLPPHFLLPAGIVIAIVVYFIGKNPVEKWGLQPMEACRKESEELEFLRTGTLDGLKVHFSISQIKEPSAFIPRIHAMYYGQVETPIKGLRFVIQNENGLLDLDKLGYLPVSIPGDMTGVRAVSNDPPNAEAIIAANADTIRRLLEWGSFVALNLPLKTQENVLFARPDTSESGFGDTGVCMAVRDVPERDQPYVCQEAMEQLVALSKGSVLSGTQ